MFYEEPLFWALISMFGLVGACAVVGSKRIGSNPLLGLIIVAIFDLGRFMLALPAQPQLVVGEYFRLLGGLIFVAGLFLGLAPSFGIRPLNVAQEQMELRTTGFYRFIRNPIYLGELLWCLGWAMIHRSAMGVALVPLWWAALLILIVIEEESLERSLGQVYLDYKARVRGRIIPGLPI